MNSDSSSIQSELIEIYSSIQGEGSIVGLRQIFLRYGLCDVVCQYCDTPLCHVENKTYRLERTAAQRDFVELPNPATPQSILDAISGLNATARHHSVALTGGEPLLHVRSLSAIAPRIRDMGLLTYLETNGHLVDAMKVVGQHIDIVGMDVKIHSTSGFPARLDANRQFLAVAQSTGCDVFIKIVVGQATLPAELIEAVQAMVEVDSGVEIILQPVSPCGGRVTPPTPSHLLSLQDAALSTCSGVKVIPQTHKMLDQL